MPGEGQNRTNNTYQILFTFIFWVFHIRRFEYKKYAKLYKSLVYFLSYFSKLLVLYLPFLYI